MSANDVNAEKLVSDLKTVVQDAEQLLKATAGDVGDKAREARERLNDALANARLTCQKLEQRAYEGAEATEKAIRENPFQSLGIAFGAGILLGIILTRK
jgi:ElaB/YqjD/DUF883 family membrane-anchored ribosome-binding protein